MIGLIKDYRLLRSLISFRNNGYLTELGWFEAFKSKSAIDCQGLPIPWCTYGFNDFIDDRLHNSFDVLEFGSGNGTLYYAKKVNRIIAIEHDKVWFDKIKQSMPVNVELIFKDCVEDGEYSKYASVNKGKYHLIIVDGQDRVNCAKNSYRYLCDNGVLILDDSEREEYAEIFTTLTMAGFKNLGFTGISPGCFYKKMTTIFYRDNNCVGL